MFKLFSFLGFALFLAIPAEGQTVFRDAVESVTAETFTVSAQPLMAYVPSKPLRICNKVGIGLHVGTQMFDYGTTMYALGTGGFKEANPLLAWAEDPLEMGIVKGGYVIGTSFGLAKLAQKHPKMTCAASLLMSGIAGYAGISNYKNIQAWRRDHGQ